VSDPFEDVEIEELRRRRTVKWTLYGPDVLAAWVAEMDFAVAPVVRDAVLAAVERQDFGYVEADLSELTEACAAFLARTHGWEVGANRIFVVADVLVGIAAALDHSVPAGAPVVVPTPAYPPFFEVVGLGGRPVVEVPAVVEDGRPTLDLDRIDAALAAGAGAVLLCNPHNPIGRAYEPAELQALAAIVQRHGARVVADELHAPLVHAGHRHTPYSSVSDAAAEHSITVTSASKAWNIPGLKCAQVITTNHADATVWRNLGVFEVAGPTPIGIAASTAAYTGGDPWRLALLDHLGRTGRLLADLVAEELPGVVLRPPDATYLAWLDAAALGLDDPAAFFLEHARVAVSDGPPFGTGFDQCVRFNFATSSAILERIVRAMGEAVRSRGS
jgi:cystathionine beta-lyase